MTASAGWIVDGGVDLLLAMDYESPHRWAARDQLESVAGRCWRLTVVAVASTAVAFAAPFALGYRWCEWPWA